MKKIIKSALLNIGIDIHKVNSMSHADVHLANFLKHHSVDLVLDVGANVGQFGSKLRSLGYSNKIVSFEPQLSAYRSLLGSSSHDDFWTVHERCGIGMTTGEFVLNLSQDSVSSSFLKANESLSQKERGLRSSESELVSISTLDSAAQNYVIKDDSLLIKVDTQGYELQVLQSASETLKSATCVLCELSIASVYNEQPDWLEIIDFMISHGFVVWGIDRAFSNAQTGRSYQVDVMFSKDALADI